MSPQVLMSMCLFFFSSRRRHTRLQGDWSSDVCSSDLQRLEWVRGAKEASTLMAELDLARSVLAKEEAEFMRSGDAVSEAERKATDAEQALERLRADQASQRERSEERRVGKECRSRWSP